MESVNPGSNSMKIIIVKVESALVPARRKRLVTVGIAKPLTMDQNMGMWCQPGHPVNDVSPVTLAGDCSINPVNDL